MLLARIGSVSGFPNLSLVQGNEEEKDSPKFPVEGEPENRIVSGANHITTIAEHTS